MDNFHRDVYCLLGLPFDAVNMADTIKIVRKAVTHRTPCFISTPNLNFLIACRSDSQLRASVINSDLSIADGMPLVWIARFLGIPIRERVPGSGLFEALRNSTLERLSVYFFGGPNGVAKMACGALNAEPSGMSCTGFASPGFGSIEDMSSDAAIAAINASNADFLLVSLGAKKGQAWIEHNRAQISVPVISHLGAVVNFVAGTIKRAPSSVQRVGLEWLWRIKEEPGLWRRYFSDGLMFIQLLATRVIPHYWFIHRHKPTALELDAAIISTCRDTSEIIVCLSGAWTRKNLEPLRQCFSAAVMTDTNLRIDLQHVSYVDTSFLGLMLLLHGHQKQRDRRLSCAPNNRQVQRMFAFGCCEFLLSAGAPS
jgi:N-acetylglucosaminyldiphosphoundecaprenol N-acetyl-beta-D-mannosaminyltransferase